MAQRSRNLLMRTNKKLKQTIHRGLDQPYENTAWKLRWKVPFRLLLGAAMKGNYQQENFIVESFHKSRTNIAWQRNNNKSQHRNVALSNQKYGSLLRMDSSLPKWAEFNNIDLLSKSPCHKNRRCKELLWINKVTRHEWCGKTLSGWDSPKWVWLIRKKQIGDISLTLLKTCDIHDTGYIAKKKLITWSITI